MIIQSVWGYLSLSNRAPVMKYDKLSGALRWHPEAHRDARTMATGIGWPRFNVLWSHGNTGQWKSAVFHFVSGSSHLVIDPIGSMYGIYANIWGILMVNVTIYSIHGSYGDNHIVLICSSNPGLGGITHESRTDSAGCWTTQQVENCMGNSSDERV